MSAAFGRGGCYAAGVMEDSVMLRRVIVSALAAVFLLACVQGGSGCVASQNTVAPKTLPSIELESAFPKLSFELPVFLCADGADSELLYVVEQNGEIVRFKNDPATDAKDTFLDIRERIPGDRHNEEGLLALAFHPRFKDNGYFFICYSQHAGGGKSRRGVISRFTWDKKKDSVDQKSEKIILEVDEPFGNHNGCTLLFGTDGYLYASFGDGGAANDPHRNGQDRGTLLATILRIDIDNEQKGKAYAIPKDNPFAETAGAAPEIWAFGLRNVWRMSFDREKGTLWAGDVGQNSYEEIDIIEKGGNYGWNKREATHAFQRGAKSGDMIDPVAEYGRDMGISITGGYVYRGTKQKSLVGIYLYGDYGTGRIWGLDYDLEKKTVKANEVLGQFPRATISSFGEDADGELFVCGHRVGAIYRVVVKTPAEKNEDKEEEDGF
ncbi:MAG: PQQ-dependent sugar dehydrogenase [Planctomycetes bacterium]|nr:PQQ-dependent sugar dehydrogenase [Planctomycetota bacterium]